MGITAELAKNFYEILAAMLLLSAFAFPFGFFFLRLVRYDNLSRWIIFPACILTGLLIVPFFFDLVSTVFGISLGLSSRTLLWLLPIVALIILNKGLRIRPVSPGETAAPLNTRRHAFILAGIGLIALIMTLAPLIKQGTPAEGERWHRVTVSDWQKHIPVAVVLTLEDDLPPSNPFLSSEPKLRYYYFGYILPSTLSKTGIASIANSLIAQAALIAASFPFLIFAYARQVNLTPTASLFSAFLVTLVSGLDSIYVFIERFLLGKAWPGHIDWWVSHADRRINSLSDMFLWTPQHALALVGLLLTLWILNRIAHPEASARCRRITLAAALGVVLAATSGTSSFVWFGLIFGLSAFALLEIFNLIKHKVHSNARVVLVIVAGVTLSLFLSLPYLSLVAGREELAFVMRVSPTSSTIWEGGIFSAFLGGNQFTYMLDFPFQMIPEFGLVLVMGFAGMWLLRKTWAESLDVRLWTVLLFVFFFIILAVRPDRADSNNFAARVAPMAWIILGVASGFWWTGRKGGKHIRNGVIQGGLLILLLLGIASTVYEPLVQFHRQGRSQGTVSTQMHELSEWLNNQTPTDAIYQMFNTPNQNSLTALYVVERKTGLSQTAEAELYVSKEERYLQAKNNLDVAQTTLDPNVALTALRSLEIDYVVVEKSEANRTFPVFDTPDFERYFERVFSNDTFAAYYIK